MPRNVEIKAKIKDFQSFLLRASQVSDKPEVIMKQTDTYFKVPEGRLKLRQIQDQVAELIFYNRPDTEAPKLSSYNKQTFKDFDEAEGLKKVLQSSLGLVGIINKERHLFMYERTRIHVDDVEHFGHFMELEMVFSKLKDLKSLRNITKFLVMLNEDETLEQGRKIVDNLMSKLGVSKSDLLSGSYINMLQNKQAISFILNEVKVLAQI